MSAAGALQLHWAGIDSRGLSHARGDTSTSGDDLTGDSLTQRRPRLGDD